MIDPQNITDFNRSEISLQEFLLFAIVVAGKNSKIQAQKLDDFLGLICSLYTEDHGELPLDYFAAIKHHGMAGVRYCLACCRMGQYTRITKAFVNLANAKINLKTVTAEQCGEISGIGPKTSRFFVLHTQKNARCAVLDTHILKYVREFIDPSAPKSTPSGQRYAELEEKFLLYYKNNYKNLYTLAEFDLTIWKMYA